MKKQRFTVLCVDGDGFGLQLRRMVLESFGCTVQACTSGREALDFLKFDSFDVVLMDNNIDEISAEDFARQIKESYPEVSLLMLSNLVYPPQSVIQYLDGFATKGEWPQELMKTIEATVERVRTENPRGPRPRWLGALAASSARFVRKAIRRAKPQASGASAPAKRELAIRPERVHA